MARGLNKVMLIGNVGQDPEVKYTQGGMAVATVSLATSSTRKDKDGNQVERTEWHRVKFFDKLAEIVREYVKKGSKLYVEGNIRYDSYEKDGVKHYTTDIIGNDMQMLGGENRESGGQRTQRPAQPARAAARPAPSRPAPAPAHDREPEEFADDDIPF